MTKRRALRMIVLGNRKMGIDSILLSPLIIAAVFSVIGASLYKVFQASPINSGIYGAILGLFVGFALVLQIFLFED